MMETKAEAQRDQAARETLLRIEEDGARGPAVVRALLREIAVDLFRQDLDVNELRRRCKTSWSAAAIDFHRVTGESPWEYISKARLETGLRLLRDTSLRVREIAMLVGYSRGSVFSDAFERWVGLRPEAFRAAWRRAVARAGPPGEEIHSLRFLAALRRGDLDVHHLRRAFVFLEKLHAPEPGDATAIERSD